VNVFQAFTPTWYKQLGYGRGVLRAACHDPGARKCGRHRGVRNACGQVRQAHGHPRDAGAQRAGHPALHGVSRALAFASAILIGFLAASTAPLMLLMAQQLMVERAGLASGLVMGLGFVTGAIGIPINGAIADSIGLQRSLMTHVVLVMITIAIAWFLRGGGDGAACRRARKPTARARS